MDLSWLCIVAYIVLMIPVMYYGISSRLKSAKRIFDARANGAFSDFNTPRVKSRIRRLAALSLLGVSGLLLSVLALRILSANGVVGYSGIVIVLAILFGGIAATAGLLIQREINRRL